MYFRSHIGKVEYDEVVGELPSWQHKSSTWMRTWQVEKNGNLCGGKEESFQ